jgi:hypothetical protein
MKVTHIYRSPKQKSATYFVLMTSYFFIARRFFVPTSWSPRRGAPVLPALTKKRL